MNETETDPRAMLGDAEPLTDAEIAVAGGGHEAVDSYAYALIMGDGHVLYTIRSLLRIQKYALSMINETEDEAARAAYANAVGACLGAALAHADYAHDWLKAQDAKELEAKT